MQLVPLAPVNFSARINVVAVAPLCENLPGPSASKPGDMSVMFRFDNYHLITRLIRPTFRVYAMNGKSVEIDNTDAEGRLILAGETFRQ